VEGILRCIDWLVEDGKDLNAFLRELLQHLRDLLVVKFCKDPDKLLDVEDSTLERLREQAKKAGEARLIRSLDLLAPLESELRRSTQPRILLELAAVKLCRPQEEDSLVALTDRIEVLERQVREGISRQASGSGESGLPDALSSAGETRHQADHLAKESKEIPEESESAEEPAAKERAGEPTPSDRSARMEPDYGQPKGEVYSQEVEPGSGSDAEKDPAWAWPEILANIKGERMAIYTLLKEAKPRMSAKNVFTLQFPPTSGFFIAAVEKEENRAFLEEQIQKVTGRKVRLRCQMKEDAGEPTGTAEDIVQKAVRVFGKDLVKIVDEKK